MGTSGRVEQARAYLKDQVKNVKPTNVKTIASDDRTPVERRPAGFAASLQPANQTHKGGST